MRTVYEYTLSNVLVIPQALFAMKDVTVLKQYRNSAICYKCLERDLVDIEFYTNIPCFVYIESGYEVLINSNNETIELHPGSAIFLPQGSNLHSDFVKKTESLKAYLVFFDEHVITDYLGKVKRIEACGEGEQSFIYLEDDGGEFIKCLRSIQPAIADPSYLIIKLQELLCLIAWKSNEKTFLRLLLTKNRVSPRRNLVRLLESHDLLHLTVSDLAHISGRSVSSFNRDFKAIYNVPPKKWLQEKRLLRAKELLNGKGLSVTEVASEVGYENVSNFIKAFKLRYGLTPKQIKLAK
jgi:AraC-like DNA-binding protein